MLWRDRIDTLVARKLGVGGDNAMDKLRSGCNWYPL